jgi:hypothetical protein
MDTDMMGWLDAVAATESLKPVTSWTMSRQYPRMSIYSLLYSWLFRRVAISPTPDRREFIGPAIHRPETCDTYNTTVETVHEHFPTAFSRLSDVMTSRS